MGLGLPPDQGIRGLVLLNSFLDSRGEISPFFPLVLLLTKVNQNKINKMTMKPFSL